MSYQHIILLLRKDCLRVSPKYPWQTQKLFHLIVAIFQSQSDPVMRQRAPEEATATGPHWTRTTAIMQYRLTHSKQLAKSLYSLERKLRDRIELGMAVDPRNP